MVTVSCQALLAFLAPILVPTACSVFPANSIQRIRVRHFYWLLLHLPNEEFDIIDPESEREPYTGGGCAGDCSERPNIRGGSDHGFAYTHH